MSVVRSVRMIRSAAAAIVLGVLVSGCSLLGGSTVEHGPNGVPKIKVGPEGNVEGAIASLERETAGYTTRVDILRLERFENALRLEFTVTPRSKGSTENLAGDFFSYESYTFNTAGITLVDPKNLRQYEPLHVDEDTCVCSRGLDDGFPLDEPTPLFVDYPAPPDSVERLTVVFPELGPLPGVQVT